jgi:hypothetical protein
MQVSATLGKLVKVGASWGKSKVGASCASEGNLVLKVSTACEPLCCDSGVGVVASPRAACVRGDREWCQGGDGNGELVIVAKAAMMVSTKL